MKQLDQYPTMAKHEHRLWLHTNLHPFGFFAGETKPAIDIRISDASLFRNVSLEDRVQFLIEADQRMIEMGYSRQKMSEDGTAAFIRQTHAQAVLWYNLP